jgi:hypothetical protein
MLPAFSIRSYIQSNAATAETITQVTRSDDTFDQGSKPRYRHIKSFHALFFALVLKIHRRQDSHLRNLSQKRLLFNSSRYSSGVPGTVGYHRGVIHFGTLDRFLHDLPSIQSIKFLIKKEQNWQNGDTAFQF